MSATARLDALRTVSQRHPKRTLAEAVPLAEVYGKNTFGIVEMRKRLPHDVYGRLQANVTACEPIDFRTAQVVAHALKEWALDQGATHFCHWFQPMTGTTAEKHDAFLTYDGDGVFAIPMMIERFSAKELVQGEPDASSFPSGGLRATFEARGYTAWDPGTAPFIMETTNGKTLCIPTAFISYTGESLDKKTPLLRSISALSDAAIRLLGVLGQTGVRRVVATVGPEQEYFLIDRAFYNLRPDLVMAGRTVFGAPPSKGQELEDQYFGSIRERTLACILEVERELVSLGVPVKTRHNEVAPAQCEIAVTYGSSSRASDQNQIVLEVFRRVASRHDFVFIAHEKPFAGVNGSGKHNNWSLATDLGDNLLEPGETPQDNLRFLCFMLATVKAVHRWGALLRCSVASPGNDHRLGANEAPPAIMSVFLGEGLTKVLDNIAAGVKAEQAAGRTLSLGVAHLPPLAKDNTDRNRTSPFAFTGNKFEFRAVGASANIAWPNTVLNTAAADAIDEIASRIAAAGKTAPSLEAAVLLVIKDVITEVRPVLFNGDNYDTAWHREAERRGLANDRDTVAALARLVTPEVLGLFAKYNVLSESEVKSRYNIALERYTKQVLIEGRVGVDMARTAVLPAAALYLGELAGAAASVAKVLDGANPLTADVGELAGLVGEVRAAADALAAAIDEVAHLHGDEPGQAAAARNKIVTGLAALRAPVDALETKMPDSRWPFPKYREMLFIL